MMIRRHFKMSWKVEEVICALQTKSSITFYYLDILGKNRFCDFFFFWPQVQFKYLEEGIVSRTKALRKFERLYVLKV